MGPKKFCGFGETYVCSKKNIIGGVDEHVIIKKLNG